MNRLKDDPDDHRPVEDRLRAAFTAKAGQVTEATLTRSTADLEGQPGSPRAGSLRPGSVRPGSGSPRHRSGVWLRPIGVAAALAVFCAGIYVAAIRPATGDQPPAPTGSVATLGSPGPGPTSGQASPTTAGEGSVRELPREQVPWAQVGAGWTVALWSATVSDDSPGTLYLVSPAGTRYAVGSAPGGSFVSSVAPDGRRVLLTRSGPTGETVTELDVTSGRPLHTFVVSSASPPAAASYTRPAGKGVLISTGQGLERRSLDGTLELAYPTGTNLGRILATPDGLALLAGTATGLTLTGNAGTLERTFNPPAGYQNCTPVGWWEPGVALTRCSQIGGSITNLFLYPVSGAPSTQLTKATTSSTDPAASTFGFTNAWKYSGGTLVQYGAGCGPGGLGMLTADGDAVPRPLKLPPTGEDGGPVLTTVNDTAYVSIHTCGGGLAQSLSTYNLVTDHTTVVLGAGVNGGNVVDFSVLGQP